MARPAKVHFRSPDHDGQLVRTLNMATVHAADLGEAMATARSVRTLDGSSWYDAWSRAAVHARAAADAALSAGEPVSARRAFLRASEYHRHAYYFVRSDLDGDRLRGSHRDHVDAFRAAAELMDHPVARLRIPYEDITLKGYLHAPDSSGAVRPTVVLPCGYDSTAESGWTDVPAALDRGYHALVFEGPGQGEALYAHRRYFRPDFEHVLAPVLDVLLTRPEVDPTGIVLVGRSFGGYLAPRAAAFEPRLAALVCDPAQPDMSTRVPRGLIGRVAAPAVRGQMRLSGNKAEFFGARMAAHGVDSVDAYLAELRRYDMLPFASRIGCPTLLVEAEHDFVGGGGATLRGALTAPAELVRLTAAHGAGGHCAGLGQQIWAGTVYPWLSRTLRGRAGP